MVVESADLARLVRSPVFTADEQSKALGALLEKAGIGALVTRFLKVVAANRRLFAIREMIKDFRKLVAHHKGEVFGGTHTCGTADRFAARRDQGRHQVRHRAGRPD